MSDYALGVALVAVLVSAGICLGVIGAHLARTPALTTQHLSLALGQRSVVLTCPRP